MSIITLPSIKAAAVNQVSPRTQQLIDATPTSGSGLSAHLCKISNFLRHDGDEDWGVEILFNLANERGYDERKARYHAERLRRKWHEDSGDYQRRPKIEPDLDLIWKTVSESSLTAAEVVGLSPVKLDANDEDATDDIVDLLFPDGDIICTGADKWDAYCATHREVSSPLSKVSFLCPNPMRERGVWKRGNPSPRCDANILYRRWVVVEFDISRRDRSGENKTFWADLIDEWEQEGVTIQDTQTRLIQRITGYEFNLGMIVFSGSKSLHSWFPVANADETEIQTFINRAMKLGADRAARTLSQYFRMPHGTNNDKKTRQPVLYLDPQILISNTKK